MVMRRKKMTDPNGISWNIRVLFLLLPTNHCPWRDIKNKLIEVIQARANNIGSGNLYVSGPFNPIPGVEDFNECSEPEYNDCGDFSVCVNLFGGFTCQCLEGYGDKYA